MELLTTWKDPSDTNRCFSFVVLIGFLPFYALTFDYHQEKDERMESNPDLFFNCATVSEPFFFYTSHCHIMKLRKLPLSFVPFLSYIIRVCR